MVFYCRAIDCGMFLLKRFNYILVLDHVQY